MILMRLKDADTLIETICHDCTYRCNEYCREIKHIINAPTVDAVPVIHGHWIQCDCGVVNNLAGRICVCSVCGHDIFTNGIDNTGKALVATVNNPYCRWCGAKMDEGR